jgi:hypothetical protein
MAGHIRYIFNRPVRKADRAIEYCSAPGPVEIECQTEEGETSPSAYEISLSFGGLTAGTKHLGSIAYGDAAGLPKSLSE